MFRPLGLIFTIILAVVAGGVFALAVSGCVQTDIHGSNLIGGNLDMATAPSTQPQPSTTGDDGGCTPGAPAAPLDPSTLVQCCNGGAAHCVPASDIPASVASQLDACPSGGSCVPDTLIRSGGAKPPSCASLNGAAGVCLSICVPQVAQYQTLLPQDVCATDERCAPCINPLTNMPSGACDIGNEPLGGAGTSGGSCTPPSNPDPSLAPTPVPTPTPAPPVCPHVGPPVIDPSTLPACGTDGHAHCLSTALVPPAMASKLAACPTGLCVPDVFIAAGGNYIPASCDSVDGAEGRCLDLVLPDVASQAATLPQSTCQTWEKCVPCYSPLDGGDTGACRLSCDPGPQKPKVTLTDCCVKDKKPEGKCVPTMSIPSAEQKQLGTDDCKKDVELCVPTEMLQPTFKPPACTANNFLVGEYTGVCLSKCLKFGIQGLAISGGNCDDLHECAPCTNPLTGKPTGAPGCPAT
jgi:hypothetical protein